MTNEIKYKLKEKTKIYRKFKKINILVINNLLNEKTIETSNLIVRAKENYNKTGGKRLPTWGTKQNWSTLDSFLGKKNMPIIPPLFDNDEIVTNYQSKAEIFNRYFASGCTP